METWLLILIIVLAALFGPGAVISALVILCVPPLFCILSCLSLFKVFVMGDGHGNGSFV